MTTPTGAPIPVVEIPSPKASVNSPIQEAKLSALSE